MKMVKNLSEGLLRLILLTIQDSNVDIRSLLVNRKSSENPWLKLEVNRQTALISKFWYQIIFRLSDTPGWINWSDINVAVLYRPTYDLRNTLSRSKKWPML